MKKKLLWSSTHTIEIYQEIEAFEGPSSPFGMPLPQVDKDLVVEEGEAQESSSDKEEVTPEINRIETKKRRKN